MKILLLETATAVCSVAVATDGRVDGERHVDKPNAHSTYLSQTVQDLMNDCGVRFADLDGVCVSGGPGSYTGLRIGVSTAKGYCYALHKPLLSVPTLQSMAAHYYALHPEYNGMVCPMIDARRMECYAAIYRRDGQLLTEVRDVRADIIAADSFAEYLCQGDVVFIGDGAAKTQPILGAHQHALYDNSFQMSAAGMAMIAELKLQQSLTEDVAYYEPFYLKDFVAKKSVVRGLR
ncbi:MAG: tRNA (adenosine(37)-N6)-threonylcarbamoyltransferase complex dimerization subunit type 1 TsaB [Bacteroidales bacterium]|nr:tRNA (adenosine(37)-N6)-threonylcarbamoyltransferase complex dimerization subunit type 1 TsaB [Candidatus Colimorpha onthohippi]